MLTENYRIREARGSDRAAIGRLWIELMTYHHRLDPRFVISADGEQRYVRHVQDLIRARDARVLVAEEIATSTVVAYVIGQLQERPLLAKPGSYGFISDIYVSERCRKQGIGTALVKDLQRWFIQRKATAMELYIADANPAAAEFWQSLGLKPFLKLMYMELQGEPQGL